MVILANDTRFPSSKRRIYDAFADVHPEPDLETQKIIDLVCGIIEQAVEDWKYLQKYHIDSTRYLAMMIYRAELIDFFNSKLFEEYLEYVLPELTPADIKVALKIPNLKGKERLENGCWNRKYNP